MDRKTPLLSHTLTTWESQEASLVRSGLGGDSVTDGWRCSQTLHCFDVFLLLFFSKE